MNNTLIAFKLADVLEIENLLSAYLSHIHSYNEKEEFFERMRLAQEARLDHILDRLNKKLSFLERPEAKELEGVIVDD